MLLLDVGNQLWRQRLQRAKRSGSDAFGIASRERDSGYDSRRQQKRADHWTRIQRRKLPHLEATPEPSRFTVTPKAAGPQASRGIRRRAGVWGSKWTVKRQDRPASP